MKSAFMDMTKAYELATINSFKINSIKIHIQRVPMIVNIVYLFMKFWRGIINQKLGDVKAACQDLNIALDYNIEDAAKEIDKYCNNELYRLDEKRH